MRLIRRVLRQNPTSPVSFEALRAIGFTADNPGICLSDLAEYLWVGVPTASKQVDDLVERGLLSRAPDPHDRRRVALTATPEGEHLIATAKRPVQDHMADLIARLDPSELARLHDGLELLRGILEPAEKESNDA